MREGKNNYSGFGGLLRYIRDWKDNRDNDLISQQRLIDAERVNSILKAQIKQDEELLKEKDNALMLAENRIQILNKKYSELKKLTKVKPKTRTKKKVSGENCITEKKQL